MTPACLTWTAAGRPGHKYPEEAGLSGPCATCGAPIMVGVPLSAVETPTMANHADYFRFGSKHTCRACAWLYDAGKGRPGNYIAFGDTLEYTVISLESVVEDKRPWLEVLRDVSTLPPETGIAGVMTTDVKPRLWPRVQMSTVGRFGLYLHAPDYDVSEFRAFSLTDCLRIVEAMLPALTSGFAKASLYHGLFRDFARASRRLEDTAGWERELSTLRDNPAFLPALIAAGVTKGDKRDVKSERTGREPEPAPTGGNQPAQTQP